MEKTIPIDDIYLMAAIKALLGIEPNSIVATQVNYNKWKGTGIYKVDNLPALSEIFISFADKKVSLFDFQRSYFSMRKKIFEVTDKEKNNDERKNENG